MAGGRKKRKKRRSPAAASGKKKGGVMMGMRSGFKNVAHSVTGVGEPEQSAKKRGSLVGTIVTVLLVAAAAVMLYRRFG